MTVGDAIGNDDDYIPYTQFLIHYPFPTFLINGRKQPGRLGLSIAPVWSNKAFRDFICSGNNVKDAEAKSHLLNAFESGEDVRNFMAWLGGESESDTGSSSSSSSSGSQRDSNPSFIVNWPPSWLSTTADVSALHFLLVTTL